MTMPKSSYLVAGIIFTLTSLYLLKYNYEYARLNSITQELLEKDDTLKFIVKTGSTEILMDYYDKDLKGADEISPEIMEMLQDECVKHKLSPKLAKERRIEVVRAKRKAVAEYSRFANEERDRSGSLINLKYVKFEEDMNEVKEYDHESPPAQLHT